jgi:hypothetical protein
MGYHSKVFRKWDLSAAIAVETKIRYAIIIIIISDIFWNEI